LKPFSSGGSISTDFLVVFGDSGQGCDGLLAAGLQSLVEGIGSALIVNVYLL
jgi:hypothetical protein